MEQKVLAVVAGHEITDGEIDALIQSMPQEQQMYAANPQFRAQCLEQLVALHAFAKLGEEQKLDETDEYKGLMENVRKDILAQLAMRKAVENVEATEEEMKAFYEENKAQFVKGAMVNAKHILMDSEEALLAVLESVNKGEKTFEDAARENSKCPSKANGGDLGEFGKGQMVKEFEEAAFTGEIGKIVGPVKTQFGYHLIKVEKREEETTLEFDMVKDNIEAMVLQQKQGEAYVAKMNELKEKYMK